MAGIIVIPQPELLPSSITPGTLESGIVSIAGVSGTVRMVGTGSNWQANFAAAPGGRETPTGELQEEDLSVASFQEGDLILYPGSSGLQLHRARFSTSLGYQEYEGNRWDADAIPDLSAQAWERIDQYFGCTAPLQADDEVTQLSDLNDTYSDGDTVSDGYRLFRASIGYISNDIATESGGSAVKIPLTRTVVDERSNSNQRWNINWVQIGMSNRWRWLYGLQTEFNNSANVTYQPNPAVSISNIGGSGLVGVTRVRVTCTRSNNTQRFQQTAQIAGTGWELDFSDQATESADRYSIEFTASGSGEFSSIFVGGTQVISSSADLVAGSRLGVIDYSRKSQSGNLDAGGFREDYDLSYDIDPSEDLRVFDALKRLQGRAANWNLANGLTSVHGFLRQFDVTRGSAVSRLRLRIEGLNEV